MKERKVRLDGTIHGNKLHRRNKKKKERETNVRKLLLARKREFYQKFNKVDYRNI